MSLFKYFKRSDPAPLKVLPQPDGPLATLMLSLSIVAANKEVKTALDSSVVWIMNVVHFFVAAKPLADRSFPYILANVIPSNFGLNNVDVFVHSHFRDQQYT